MTDHEEPGFDGHDDPARDDVSFDDPAHAGVRDLLAEARVTEPVPDDVADRLDATLASLQARRSAELSAQRSDEVAVLPLRRRLAPRLLAAAAAVIVIGASGVGIAQIVDNASLSSASDDSKAAGAANGRADSDKAESPEVAGGNNAERQPQALEDLLRDGLPELSRATFAADAARVMLAATVTDTAGTVSPTPSSEPQATVPDSTSSPSPANGVAPQAPPLTSSPAYLAYAEKRASATCPGPSTAEAEGAVTVPARLDDTVVALVFRPPTAAGQLVEAWSCDGSRLLISATVPR